MYVCICLYAYFVCAFFSIYSLLIVPQAGPDTKYLLAFIRTQMSTTVTIGFVFGSKVNDMKSHELSKLIPAKSLTNISMIEGIRNKLFFLY